MTDIEYVFRHRVCRRISMNDLYAVFFLWLGVCSLGMPGFAHAAPPAYQAAGTAVGNTGSVSPAWPTHATGDIALLFVESAGGEPVTLSTAAGFVQVSNSPQATGAGTAGTQIAVFWARATSNAMSAPTVADPGNHVYAQIITYRGVVASGDPWDVSTGGVKATASTSVAVAGVTTTLPDTLVVQVVSRDLDSNTAAFSSQTNASLTGIAERSDAGTTQGNGGGFAVWDGVKATAGATGNTSATVTRSLSAFLTLALKRVSPAVVSITRAGFNPTSPATAVAWTVTFNASVTGVDTADFSLVQSGGVSGATITSVTGSGTTWTVNASTGTGGGLLGLNLVDNDTIVNASAIPLGDVGAGNGNFTGDVYNVFSCTPPSNVPSGISVSCVCDTFGRASLNPSTIFGGNFSLSNSDGLGNAYINATTGLLRLTENTGYNAKAATVPGIFPAAGNYISAEFMHYAYDGSNPGADGVAVTLSDYSVPAVPGGFGGSLGYAQRNDGAQPPGFAGGWVGVALDEWGNYQNPTEGRVNGPGFIAQSVGVRGPGSGANGYRWMGGTPGNPGGLSIDNQASATPAPGYMYQVIVDARNYAGGTVNVSVNRDSTTKDGSTYASLFGPFNAYTEASYALSQGWISKLVPDYWKISFTGSTGGANNVHEIGALRICAQTVFPSTGGTASGFSAIDEAYPGAPTVPSYPNFQTGNIYMKLVGTSFKLWVAALTGTGIQTGYSSVANKYVQVKLVDNTDNACGPDSARTCNSTCTNKAAVEAGATQIATFASGGTTGVASPSPTYTLNSAYKNLIAVMKECTTSACTAFTATAAACSADSFSVRPLSIASVVSPNATNTGIGGTPIFKADGDSFSLTATTTGVAGNPSKYDGVMKINNPVVQALSPATVAGVVTGSFPAATSATPSSTAAGVTFKYSEVGGFGLPGYDPASDATSRRGVYDGVDMLTECAPYPSPMTPAQVAACDALKAASWTGVDSISTKGDCVAESYSNTKTAGKYGCNFGLLPNSPSPATWSFGRFVPNEFRVVSPVLTNRLAASCPASIFSYLDEGMGLTYTLEARSGSGSLTKNYAGALAKLTLPADGSTMNFAAAVVGPPFAAIASNRIVGSAFTGSWPALGAPTAGQVALAGTVAVSSLTVPANNRVSPDGPFKNASLGIAPVDSDGVRIVTYDLDSDNSGGAGGPDHATLGTTNLYFGEIRLLPAIGSERLPLTMTAEILRWNGTGFAPNGDDSCTQVPAARLALSGWTKNLSAGETTLPAGPLTFAAGRGTLRLSAPGAGNDGSVLVTADLTTAGLSYLSGRWSGAAKYNQNPSAIAAFGLYKGAGPVIHFRENY